MDYYYRVFVTEFRKAVSLYSRVFFGTILVSIVAFYIYGAIKGNYIAQNVILTLVAYFVTVLFGLSSAHLLFRDFKPLLISLFEKIKQVKEDTYVRRMEAFHAKRLEIEIQQFNQVLRESLTIVETLRKNNLDPGKLDPDMIRELDRVKSDLIEHIDPSPSVLYTLAGKFFRWKQPIQSQISEKAHRHTGSAS